MRPGEYTRYLLCDIQDFGWHCNRKRRYIGALWGTSLKDERSVLVTSMEINTLSENSQFNRVFRLLNGDKPFGRIHHDSWLKQAQDVIHANDYNFYIKWERKATLYVKDITLCHDTQFRHEDGDWLWPGEYARRIVQKQFMSPDPQHSVSAFGNCEIKSSHVEMDLELENFDLT